MPVRIIIADDHRLFREGLVNLLSDSKDIEIIAEADNGKDAIEKAKALNPDIIVMDIGMPILNGVEATGRLLKEFPEIKVIALSMHSEKQFIKGMLEAGAAGYLFKNCAYDELIEAIHTVNAGKKYLSDKITEIMIQDYLGKEESIPESDSELTERESEILKLIAEGVPTSEISELLFVSVKTIGTHKQHLLEKLNLKTSTDLVKYAIKKGIISLD
jgi:DNA-binding NarL/FixJ family response regulator